MDAVHNYPLMANLQQSDAHCHAAMQPDGISILLPVPVPMQHGLPRRQCKRRQISGVIPENKSKPREVHLTCIFVAYPHPNVQSWTCSGAPALIPERH